MYLVATSTHSVGSDRPNVTQASSWSSKSIERGLKHVPQRHRSRAFLYLDVFMFNYILKVLFVIFVNIFVLSVFLS